MEVMFVYLGKYLQCECGLETNLISTLDEPLRTGDIVMVYLLDENYNVSYASRSLSVVVCGLKEYPSGVANDAYVMGIKDATPDDGWQIDLVKRFENVVDGEHWDRFGFRYSKILEVQDA